MQEQQGSLEFLSSSSIMVLGLLIVAVTVSYAGWHGTAAGIACKPDA